MRKIYTHGDITKAGGGYHAEIFAHSWNGDVETAVSVSSVSGTTEEDTLWEVRYEISRLQKIENERHAGIGGFRARA